MLDITKPVTTRDGRAARIISSDMWLAPGESGKRIVALVQDAAGQESVSIHLPNGTRIGSYCSPLGDLINAAEGGVKWLNVWNTNRANGRDASTYETREIADAAAKDIELGSNNGMKRIACVSVPWKVGEGL